MKNYKKDVPADEAQISSSDFLKYYNQNIPESFPRVSAILLEKFKNTHSTLFKHGNMWSLEQHRKKMMDWLPLNSKIS